MHYLLSVMDVSRKVAKSRFGVELEPIGRYGNINTGLPTVYSLVMHPGIILLVSIKFFCFTIDLRVKDHFEDIKMQTRNVSKTSDYL